VGVCVGYEATIVFNLLIPPEKECMNHEPTATEPALLSLEQDAYFFGCGFFLYDTPRLNLCPRSDQAAEPYIMLQKDITHINKEKLH
jgi:hypothetical protein